MNKIIIADGIAPINGPKNGIIFVIPIITEINNEYGILKIVKIIKVKTPIIAESIIFPPINFPNVKLVRLARFKIIFACLSLNNATTTFFPSAKNFYLSTSK